MMSPDLAVFRPLVLAAARRTDGRALIVHVSQATAQAAMGCAAEESLSTDQFAIGAISSGTAAGISSSANGSRQRARTQMIGPTER
jgi:hypothetical protein